MCRFVHATAYGELRRSFTSLHSRVASALVRALLTDALVLASACVKTLADREMHFGAISTFRGHGAPYGLHDALCTLRLSCSPTFHQLRHRRNTRYGWVASPYPTGTCTPQDTPGFAWRANACHQRFLGRFDRKNAPSQTTQALRAGTYAKTTARPKNPLHGVVSAFCGYLFHIYFIAFFIIPISYYSKIIP